MGVNWTKEQFLAINEKGKNILVAAAAGSGKTAVLVERIINKIINEDIDIDKLLVVTFTNAAAAEMRERILDAIYNQIELNPDNSNLQRQITLLNKASICTIHSFCLDVIRNNFYEIDVSPNFKIGDTQEVELLKYDVLEELFEEKYEEKNEDFIELINTYTNYRSDDSLKELILNIYNYIQSSPFPEEWINEKVEMFNGTNLEEDFGVTKWGKILLGVAKETVENSLKNLEKTKKELGKFPELFKFYSCIINDIEKLENLNKNLDLWENAYEAINELTFEKWPIDRKVILEEKEIAKEQRDKVKKEINKLKDSIFICSSGEANKDISEMYNVLVALKNIVLDFKNLFEEKKAEKNIIDFNYIELLALKKLVKKDEEGKIVPTEVAKKYMEKFSEIAIDEYQDSNLVQEYILSSISNGSNMFMVGDVKQSIYKFRQACPELFLEKYVTYKKIDEFDVGEGPVSAQKNISNVVGAGLVPAQENTSDSLKIQLFKNFRSRDNVLKYTNIIFENIMSKKLGDIDYTEEEFLNLGATYPESNGKEHNIEINIIDLNEGLEEESDEDKEIVENIMVEAKLVAKKIQELINSKYQVYDRKLGYRDVEYKDIVILLRSTSDKAEIYEKELSKLEIPVFSDSNSSYLETPEIQTVINMLKIIDNPMQDIPLVSILRSPIANFTDDELIEIRAEREQKTFYESLLEAIENVDGELKIKIQAFLNMLENFKTANEYLPLNELIWKIYEDTGYLNIVTLMKNGELKYANLKMLFEKAKQYENASFKGLFNFILFIDKIKTSSGDMGSAKLIGENANVVRIMSIHKSKGLEFPVVFLSETGKKFNLQDLNESILMHQKLGFGPKRINYKKYIEYNTLAKEALKNIIKDETISEEMRVLYVALTRAKEKLIITGRVPNLAKSRKEKEELIEVNNKLTPFILKKYKSYLDWFILVYLKNKEELNNILEINEYKTKDILTKEEVVEKEKLDIKELVNKNVDKLEVEKIKKDLNWKYAMMEATKFISKTSVSEIKEISIKSEQAYEKINLEPKFLTEEKAHLNSSEKGTLMHLILQKLDFKKEHNIQEFLQELLKNNIIDELEYKNVNIQKIENFLNSNLAKRIKTAKEMHKEEPFYINLEANEIYDTDLKDEILVQGVIDMYFIDEQGKIVLLDYKTDYVENEEELAKKYEVQLNLYKRALEKALNKKVDEVYIYSTHMDKAINIAKLCKI